MIDEADRGLAERWAWWALANTPSAKLGGDLGGMHWWLSFEAEPLPLDDDERAGLLGRVFRRLQEYKAGADYEPSAEDYAEWIGLDLGGVFESARKLTQALVERAIEHGRGLGA